jgi:hypothetical protein
LSGQLYTRTHLRLMIRAVTKAKPTSRRLAVNRISSSTRADLADPAGATGTHAIEEFVKFVKNYRELLGLIACAVVGVIFIRDYFATKEEVEILKCQAVNGISIVESRMKTEQLAKRVIAIRLDLDDQKRRPVPKKPDIASLKQLELEEADLKDEIAQSKAREKKAGENLQPGACEKLVRAK